MEQSVASVGVKIFFDPNIIMLYNKRAGGNDRQIYIINKLF